jgi:hypothetical protein
MNLARETTRPIYSVARLVGKNHVSSLCLPKVLASAGGHYGRGLPGGLLYYRVSTEEFAFLGDSIEWAMSAEGHEPPA